MSIVYVKEQGSAIRKRAGRMVVMKDSEILLEIPLRDTTSVAVFGNVQVTTQAMSEFLDSGIALSLFTRNGRLKGHLTPEASKNMPLRIKQYECALDPVRALKLAKAVVRAKLKNSAALVADYRAHYPGPALEEAARGLSTAAQQAEKAEALDQLRGFEGAAAAAHFRAFAVMNRSEFPFPGRRRRPTPDPINALLSFGYTLLTNELRGLLEGAGFEPLLGFLHQVEYGRPSLALDLVEPFRSQIDRLTLRLVNERMLTAKDFATHVSGPRAGSVVLMPDSIGKYLGEFETFLESRGIRRAMGDEVEALGRAVRDGVEFVAWGGE